MDSEIVKKLKMNKKGRDFAVGDIHGCYSILEDALAAANFDTDKDRLISVGDLTDRGPESERALSFLQKEWFHAVRGNHDQAVADFSQDIVNNDLSTRNYEWCHQMGAGWLFHEENGAMLASIHDAFNALPYVIEIETTMGKHGVIHAEIEKGKTWNGFKQSLRASVKKDDPPHSDHFTRGRTIWGRDRITDYMRNGIWNPDNCEQIKGINRLFVGHTLQEGGCTKVGNVFYIDTGAAYRRFLTVTNILADADDITAEFDNTDRFQVIDVK